MTNVFMALVMRSIVCITCISCINERHFRLPERQARVVVTSRCHDDNMVGNPPTDCSSSGSAVVFYQVIYDIITYNGIHILTYNDWSISFLSSHTPIFLTFLLTNKMSVLILRTKLVLY